jgi:hypothetical protein
MRRAHNADHQGGIILIICLIFLAIISITAAVTVRSATSSEAVANSSRTQALAMQAAEAALLFCERQVKAFAANPSDGMEPVAAPLGAGAQYRWEQLTFWDGTGTDLNVTVVPFADSASTGAARYFRRSPECMAQYASAGSTTTSVITARGFGPDVAQADVARSAPKGAEVWLQSILTLE